MPKMISRKDCAKIREESTKNKVRNDGGHADSSTTDISDEWSQGHTDSSTASEATEVLASPKSNFRAPPGLLPPPGLDGPTPQEAEGTINTGFKYWDRVISQQIEQTCSGQHSGMEQAARWPIAPNQPPLHPRRPKQPSPAAKD